MFQVDVVSLFPEMFAPFIGLSILGRALERGIVNIEMHNVLDALEPSERADERPFGGGPGMVMRLEPLARILDGIIEKAAPGERRRIILTSPGGRRFSQQTAEELSKLERLVLICGHYEGVDERLAGLYPIEEFSLGNFVMTGGEIAALAFLDATARLLDGTLRSESSREDFLGEGLLDYPSYTRPRTFRGAEVPAVLLSGDHQKIARWRREAAQERTRRQKDAPD